MLRHTLNALSLLCLAVCSLDARAQDTPRAGRLVVENGGHETLPSEEVQSVVVDFFEGRDVGARSVRFDPPRFLSVEELKARGAGGRR